MDQNLWIKTSAARDILAYWLALILAVLTIGFTIGYCAVAAVWASALRDTYGGEITGGRRSSYQMVRLFNFGFRTGLAGGLIYMQKAHFTRCRIQRVGLDRLCDFHCRRHRHNRRPHHRCDCLFPSAEHACRLWQLIADPGVIGIAIMLFAPRSPGDFFFRCIQIFPVQRRLIHKIKTRRIQIMAEITTDVLIIGTGPAGSSCARLLSSYIDNMVVNRYRWLANTPPRIPPINARWRYCASGP